MEQLHTNPEKHFINEEERAELQRALGQIGLVDASQFNHPTVPHPEDDRWGNVIPSNN